jgi:tRNA1(Val) A37 N6-methylase TrmN6
MLDTISLQQKTIDDFEKQWTKYNDSEVYYCSVELFQDILGPLLPVKETKDSRVAEIGSGAGRILDMLLTVGVKHVTAIKPSEGYYFMEK